MPEDPSRFPAVSQQYPIGIRFVFQWFPIVSILLLECILKFLISLSRSDCKVEQCPAARDVQSDACRSMPPNIRQPIEILDHLLLDLSEGKAIPQSLLDLCNEVWLAVRWGTRWAGYGWRRGTARETPTMCAGLGIFARGLKE